MDKNRKRYYGCIIRPVSYTHLDVYKRQTKKLFLAERDSTETSVSLLEDQLTAVDIQTGAGVAKVVGDMYELSLIHI